MRELPTGTVTFLFTDIEGSTRLLHELGERYVEVRAEHHRAIRSALAAHAGVEVDTQGDAFFAAFARASDAVAAAAEIQRDLAAGPIRVRIGVHTGEPTVTDEGYVGVDVHRAARISAAGHGGQVLLSQTTRDLVEADVRDLGEHRLKDLTPALRLYQFGAGEFPPLRTLYQTNLPVQPTPFVGRERELREVLDLLREHKLVTLTGAGGSGKTRLALQAAAELGERFGDGVWFVPLAAITDALFVPEVIGRVLNVTRLPEGLRSRHALLVLDNLEHLIDQVSPVVAGILSVSPDLSILCTSRERLGISAEQEYVLPTLPVDDAVELFVQRARRLRPDFAPDEHVARLVLRLDGLPLALELAAARTKVLTPAQILERLGGTVGLLASGFRDAPVRQRSLRATLDWSYGLLGPQERGLFRALAVFAGGWTLDAAEEVCEGELDVLQSLVDKSLVGFVVGRYTMLETVREYALEQLRLEGSLEAMRRRHVDYYLPLAEAVDPHRRRADVGWLEWADAEHGNLREALGYLHEAGDAERELRLAAALVEYWNVRGHIAEGRQRLGDALGRPEGQPPAVRADALNGFVRLSILQGEHEQALSAAEECLHLLRELGDRVGEAWALLNLSSAYELVGDRDEARTRLEASGALFRELEEWSGVVSYLANRGNLALIEQDYEHAIALFEEGLAVRRRLGWREGRHLLANLGFARFAQGRHAEAQDFLRRGLELSLAVGDKMTAMYALEGLAALAAVSGGDDSRAARLFGAAAALREKTGAPRLGAEAPVYERTLATLRERLGDAGLSSALADGRRMSLADAAAEALSLD